jgi:hypothetical protein
VARDRAEEIKYFPGGQPSPGHLARGLWNWCEDSVGVAPEENDVRTRRRLEERGERREERGERREERGERREERGERREDRVGRYA